MKNNNVNAPTRLFKLLTDIAPNKVFMSIVLGCLGGLAYSIFVPLIMLSLQPSMSQIMQPDFDTSYWLLGTFEISSPAQAAFFLFVCFIIVMCRGLSGTMMAQVSVAATVGLRKKLYSRISQMPIQDLDKVGPSRLLTSLNNDVADITAGATAIPQILIAFSTFGGLIAFLVYLKLEIFLFIMAILIIGFTLYTIPNKLGSQNMAKARNNFDKIQEGMRGLIYGAKELKLNKEKQQAYISESLYKIEQEFSGSFVRGRSFFIYAMIFSNLMSFLAIGAVAYIMSNTLTISTADLTAVVMVLLYITGPMTAMTGAIPPVMIAKVSARKLDILLKEMTIEPEGEIREVEECQNLHVKDLEYFYPVAKGEKSGFKLGPVDLTINRGEVTYLVGGNGSGKTTLAKILSLHHIPDNGGVYFDDQVIDNNNRNAYRQSISAIFSDFYLFPKLFGLSDEELDKRASDKLEQLGLADKVTIKNGEFSSTSLSDGQKKRLALLVTYLEDRSIYVFDEWAADQDPEFKEIFYYNILPNLKKLNKIVIVVTHDDRYFHLADKLVRMESGKVLDEQTYEHLEEVELKNHPIESGGQVAEEVEVKKP